MHTCILSGHGLRNAYFCSNCLFLDIGHHNDASFLKSLSTRMYSYLLLVALVACCLQSLVSIQEGALTSLNQEWLHIDDGVIWVYSSFWELRIREGAEFGIEAMGNGPYLRVLMIGPFNDHFPQTLKQSTCEYYYEEFSVQPFTTKVVGVYVPRVDDIYSENLSRPYILYCEAPPRLSDRVPKAMAFNLLDYHKRSWAKDMSGSTRKWLVPIKGDPFVMHAPFSPQRRIMACIKPIHGGPFTDIAGLINFLVLNTALGIQHFVIYDAGDGSPQLYRALNVARKAGVSLEVRTWNLREHHGWMLTQTIHGEACMHDAMLLGYENVITMDLDEALVTHQDLNNLTTPTYSDLLDYLDQANPTAAYYRFSNVFYLPTPEVPKDEFLVGLYTHRHLSPTPNGSRTKCIYKPHRVSQVYTHFGTPLNSSYQEVVINPEVAHLHHYRRHAPPGGFHKSDASDDFTIRERFGKMIQSSAVYEAFATELKVNPLKE